MSRIEDCFARLGDKTALLPFITAGYPQPDQTVPLMHALAAAGADMIELGVPFSDPQADGPVIQRASERALANGVSLDRVLAIVKTFRQDDADTPVLLMGYLNPIEKMGYETFAERAARAGVDACLTVDLPPEEGAELTEALRVHGIDSIYLAAPTSTAERLRRIGSAGGGFVYYVSLKGVTGSSGTLQVGDLAARVQELKKFTELPVVIGFGVRDPESAQRVAAAADGVVVGSALIETLETAQAANTDVVAAAGDFVAGLRRALN